MKHVLFFLTAGILLLGCTDSKEAPLTVDANTPANIKRVVAREYHVLAPGLLSIDCVANITNQQDMVLKLKDGQLVKLATSETMTKKIDGDYWLYIYANDNPALPCYVKTKYLVPVPLP